MPCKTVDKKASLLKERIALYYHNKQTQDKDTTTCTLLLVYATKTGTVSTVNMGVATEV